jgi:Succinylglutamate desuccinylase / Aspartoacylase family
MIILCGTHGNEALGPELYARLEQTPIKGVRSRIVHPQAVRQGKRYLGSSQLMRHYPGDPAGDPEDIAAYLNLQWLGSAAGSDRTLIYDIHNTNIRGPGYFAVGLCALQATMVGAVMLGYTRCLIESQPFYRSVTNAAALETFADQPDDFDNAAGNLCAGLARIAALGVDKLQSQYKGILPQLHFYRKHEILTQSPGGTLTDFLPELERIHVEQPFTPVDLPHDVQTALGFKPGSKLLARAWGYHNMSPVQPDLGLAEIGGRRVPRRVYFGSLLQETAPPTIDGKWVMFEEAAG